MSELQWSGTGRPPVQVLDGKLTCTRCSETKLVSEFFRDRTRACGYSPHCKQCRKSPKQGATPVKDSVLWTKYGIRLEDYEVMYEAQEGKCKICGKFEEVLAVDHCHDTKVVRGLLCRSCNAAIGLLGEDPDNARRAMEYLESFHLLQELRNR